jgi:DNA-binding transcriptional MerR regulator
VVEVSASTIPHRYTIKEAAALTGLPASTLRYYETIGLIAPVGREASSKHRSYSEDDLQVITGIACLAATGMSLKDMQQYVANASNTPVPAEQVDLLTKQKERLALEAEMLVVRQRYVDLKIAYWQALDAGDSERAEALSRAARGLADDLSRHRQS